MANYRSSKILTEEIHWHCSKGRPKWRWIDGLKGVCALLNLTIQKAAGSTAQDRRSRRGLVPLRATASPGHTSKVKSSENLPYIRLGTMTFFPNDFWCHPVRSSSHWPENQGTHAASCHILTEPLGTTKVDQFDHAVWHQHHVTALYVSTTRTNRSSAHLS